MRILVIGAAGQLGHDLLKVFSPEHEVFGADMTGTGAQHDVDITDPTSVNSLLVDLWPDLVINSAAFTNVDGCEAQKDICREVNADGAGNIARSCADMEAGDVGMFGRVPAKMIHVSTDYVFDGSKRTPYVEDDPTAPLGEYGRTKFDGEEQVRKALPERHLIVRTAWLFGDHGANFVKTMLRLGRERDQLKVVNDQTGSPTYALHLAKAIKSLTENRLGHPGVYHMTNSGQCTWFDFAREIFRLAGVEVDLQPTTTAAFNAPAPRPAYSVLANTRATEIEMPQWRDGLVECLSAINELNTAN
ncbi:MAG: dTDP-4-dehydrorhamnose reductase [Thermoleophilia bacterium]|nr:dTDP-4-dehydrorhamnose reductase [Thermoleophilia bacterium]